MSGDWKLFFRCFGARDLLIGQSSDLYTGGAILVSIYWMIMDLHGDTMGGGGKFILGAYPNLGGN